MWDHRRRRRIADTTCISRWFCTPRRRRNPSVVSEIDSKLEKEGNLHHQGLSLEQQRQQFQGITGRDVNNNGGEGGGGGGQESYDHYRHLLLHHLAAKHPPEQPRFHYHHPTPPQPHQLFLQQPNETHQLFAPIEAHPTAPAENPPPPSKKRSLGSSSRTALRNAAVGEIVKVEGGHIMRSTGRKDRHSKVCTAKGPRDRRVRLAAHTAIQFYDVQDRLGYDRPSKAVDWLIKKAKAAIDELDELPAWKPQATVNGNGEIPGGEKSDEGAAGGVFDSGGLLPPSMESDSIADTIKSFFPIGGDESSPSGSVGLQSAQFQSQDLKLSLQSFQDTHRSHQNQESEQQSPFPAAAQLGFDSSSVGWDETQQGDMGRFQRLIGWNLTGGNYGGGESGGGGGGFMFISPQPLQQQPLLFGHGVGSHGGFGHTATHLYSQGGTLQSNCTTTTPSNQDHHHHHQQQQQPISFHPGSLSAVGFSSLGGFSNFHMPGRIQDDDDEEEQDSNTNKPSSVSSGSRH